MNKTRESGIELLKIIAIFLIVISHTNQTLTQSPLYIAEYANNYFNINNYSLSFQMMALQILEYFGSLGNCIFLYLLLGFCVITAKQRAAR